MINFFGANLISHHADYRLLSNKVVKSILKYHESNLFLRGLISEIGFQTQKVYYKRSSRKYGQSKYTVLKMITFAWNGLTSFTAAPLKWILYLGIFMLSISIVGMLWIIGVYISGKSIIGWSSIIMTIFFFGGINMFALGIIGEYIRKIFLETKKRPLFLVDKIVGKFNNHD